MSTPMRRTRSCARAARGQATAASASPLMNSRRLTAAPEAKDKPSYRFGLGNWKAATNVRFGSKADIVAYPRYVRFTPKADTDSEAAILNRVLTYWSVMRRASIIFQNAR